MDARKKSILNAIISDYIDTAEPVGSRAIADKYQLKVSSATIRNEMVELEEMGYIRQPHVSAGRVPSDKGYRFYVDHLMPERELSAAEKQLIRERLAANSGEEEELVRQCCQILSALTNDTVIMTVPRHRGVRLSAIHLLPMNEATVMVLLVSDAGTVHSQIVEWPEQVQPSALLQTQMLLQQKLLGMSFDRVSRTLHREIVSLCQHRQLMEATMELLTRAFSPSAAHTFFYGTMNMLKQPEFRDLDRVRNVLGILEDDDRLHGLLEQQDGDGEGSGPPGPPGTSPVRIAIGAEMPDTAMNDCSMVSAEYQINGRRGGTLGVLGPKRMQYAEVRSLVEFVTEELSEILSRRKPRTYQK